MTAPPPPPPPPPPDEIGGAGGAGATYGAAVIKAEVAEPEEKPILLLLTVTVDVSPSDNPATVTTPEPFIDVVARELDADVVHVKLES